MFLILVCFGFIPAANALPSNSWSDHTRGTLFKWETGSEWSLGVPPSTAQSSILITNLASSGIGLPGRTVFIDGTTILSNAI